jgi:carboxypeptidase Taq
MNKAPSYEKYVNHLQQMADLEAAIAVLSWDKEVYMPEKGAPARTRQVATLSGMAHELFVDPVLEETLHSLKENPEALSPARQKNIERTLQDLSRVKKLNTAFVIERSKAVSETYHAWLQAREANSFASYKDKLERLVDIKRQEAELVGYEQHPYDALLDEFEHGSTTQKLDGLFEDVKNHLVDFVREIRRHPSPDDRFLAQFYPADQQWQWGLELLSDMGYDFKAGRQDKSPHPFTINFSSQDVRVTTRVDEQHFGTMTWSCLHEGGHALYEQGLPADQYGLPLGRAVSLGIHESQSRLWENHVGRSRAYWSHYFPKLRERFPEQLRGVDSEQFYKGINKVFPSLIRVESDELHYHFHILIRFEIERDLMAGTLKVADLEQAWNDKYKTYLDLDVPSAKEGVLQDIHWAHGSLGYFPTYSQGSFYAAQFYHQAQQDIPGLKDQIGSGDYAPLLQWLRTNIHQHGRYYQAEDLCKRVTGEGLSYRFFQSYVEEKFMDIYEVL